MTTMRLRESGKTGTLTRWRKYHWETRKQVYDDIRLMVFFFLHPACGVHAMGPNQTVWRGSQVQLYAAQGCIIYVTHGCILFRFFSGFSFYLSVEPYVTQSCILSGFSSNFHVISQLNLESSNTNLARISNFNIIDEKCGRSHCSVCEVPAPVIQVRVRGLCQLSLFDRFSI